LSDVIITCQECQTQFQLDDAKVPETGIRVRCSRCKCAFFVESPHRPDPDHASQLAREALTAQQSQAGEPSLDSTPPDEESDWQFNEDVDPVAGAESPESPVSDLAAARSAVDDLLGGSSAASVASVDESVDPVTGEPDVPESDFDLSADDDLGIGGTDLSAESELEAEAEDDPNAVTVERGNWSGSSADLSSDSGLELDGSFGADDADPPPLEAHREPVPESAADSAEPFGEVSEDLGSPAGWDFFEDNDEPPSAGFAAVAQSPGSTESDAGFRTDDSPAFAASDYAPEVEGSRGDAWFTRLRGVLGWALVTALCGYACTVMFFPGLLTAASDPMAMRVAGFEVVHVEGHWVENAVAGPIYVVSGAFHNAGGTRPAPGSVLRIRLIDAHGATVVAESAAVGPPIPTVRLRESNPRDLRSEQERAAAAILHDPLERRKRRPFMAVLGNIPAGAVAFDLEVATMTATAPEPVAALEAASELEPRAAGRLAGAGMLAAESAAEAATPAETR
jgi:predicted Zn finger-like uncharacterized protein